MTDYGAQMHRLTGGGRKYRLLRKRRDGDDEMSTSRRGGWQEDGNGQEKKTLGLLAVEVTTYGYKLLLQCCNVNAAGSGQATAGGHQLNCPGCLGADMTIVMMRSSLSKVGRYCVT